MQCPEGELQRDDQEANAERGEERFPEGTDINDPIRRGEAPHCRDRPASEALLAVVIVFVDRCVVAFGEAKKLQPLI